MKSFSYLFMAGLMTLGFWACSDEANLPTEEGKGSQADKVYMSFNLELPTASRAETEPGTTQENTITSLDVVLATVNEGVYTAVAVASNVAPAGANTAYVATFEASNMTTINGAVKVFVFCNLTEDTGWTNVDWTNVLNGAKTNITNVSEIATADNFLMTNAELVEAQMPADYTIYNTPASAFNLGEVNVERAAARFDYKQTNDNEYTINTPVDLSSYAGNVTVTLTHMALVNMSNNFYYLRRVAPDNGNPTEPAANLSSIQVGGAETTTNYVVDADATTKNTKNLLPENYLNYWSAEATNTVEINTDKMDLNALWTRLNTATETTSMSTGFVNDDHKPWRYATENTLPSVNKQIKSLSTGVLFKGRLSVTDDRLDGTKAYVYNNVLYGSWSQIDELLTDNPSEVKLKPLKAAYDAAQATVVYPDTEPTLANASKVGFTVYTKEDGIFPVYYYYVNKHNDNADDKVMAPMEFAVVRNNVYQLSVTDIDKFGHPAEPEGDPDPIDPSEEDEEEEVYFTVSVRVLPWVVRTNNIEF